MIQAALDSMPIIAILRGIRPEEVSRVGKSLYEAGIRCIEVPLNSPSPYDSIRELALSVPDDCLVGAGTVTTEESVRKVQEAGGKLIIAPNTDRSVIEKSIAFDLEVIPGIATPTDAFSAINAGARWLKLFPASTYGPNHLSAIRAVLPSDVRIVAVGGISKEDFSDWRVAGAAGFGIGSALYRAGDSYDDVKKKAEIMTASIRQ